MRLAILLLAAIPALAAGLGNALEPKSAFDEYAQNLWSDAVPSTGYPEIIDAPEGAGLLGTLSGVVQKGGEPRGLVVGFRHCEIGTCYAGHLSLLQLRGGVAVPFWVYGPLDLGAPGPLEPAAPGDDPPAEMIFPVLPVISLHDDGNWRTRRLTLLDLRSDELTVLFQDNLEILTKTDRKMSGTNLRVEAGGEMPTVVMDWQVLPGPTDHDAYCTFPLRERRLDFDGRSYREMDPVLDICQD